MKNMLFDLYGTLVDIHTDENRDSFWKAVAAWFKDHGASYRPKELKECYLSLVDELTAHCSRSLYSHESSPEIEIEKVFSQLFEEKGVTADEKLITQTAHFFRKKATDYIRLYPGARELLKELKKAGKNIYLVSNAQKIFTMKEMEDLGIADLFDKIYISSEYGIKKPDPNFFQICIDENGLDVNDSIMIGNDGTCDIAGGKAAGLKTFYLASNLSPVGDTADADYEQKAIDLVLLKDQLLSL